MFEVFQSNYTAPSPFWREERDNLPSLFPRDKLFQKPIEKEGEEKGLEKKSPQK
jgi:hypothetical protein